MITDPRGLGNTTPVAGGISFAYPAASPVQAKDLVAILCDVNGKITVAPAASGSHVAGTKCGVAGHAGATGEMIQVTVFGPALCKTAAAAPAVGAALGIGTGAGVPSTITADATTVVGTVKATVISAEVGTDTAWVWVH